MRPCQASVEVLPCPVRARVCVRVWMCGSAMSGSACLAKPRPPLYVGSLCLLVVFVTCSVCVCVCVALRVWSYGLPGRRAASMHRRLCDVKRCDVEHGTWKPARDRTERCKCNGRRGERHGGPRDVCARTRARCTECRVVAVWCRARSSVSGARGSSACVRPARRDVSRVVAFRFRSVFAFLARAAGRARGSEGIGDACCIASRDARLVTTDGRFPLFRVSYFNFLIILVLSLRDLGRLRVTGAHAGRARCRPWRDGEAEAQEYRGSSPVWQSKCVMRDGRGARRGSAQPQATKPRPRPDATRHPHSAQVRSGRSTWAVLPCPGMPLRTLRGRCRALFQLALPRSLWRIWPPFQFPRRGLQMWQTIGEEHKIRICSRHFEAFTQGADACGGGPG